MGTPGAGRKRLPNRERLTAEDDALNQIAREEDVEVLVMLLETQFCGCEERVQLSGKTQKYHFDVVGNVPELCPPGEFGKCPHLDLSTKGISD
ncbi:hypothetical protein DUI87_30793 [Hirundo rustica rustica]|uniref:Uncharacterized protein n=1 Tax=Hirundo rustica rustica TaxID=333673 RepID=A0A3M0J173_HIRRU|nr:hypothetical protein DUI87_30793 [Hirundo rustica rustica]